MFNNNFVPLDGVVSVNEVLFDFIFILLQQINVSISLEKQTGEMQKIKKNGTVNDDNEKLFLNNSHLKL